MANGRAEIGRFDGVLQAVAFRDGETVNDLLRKAGLTLASGEEVNDEDGNPVSVTSPAEESTYFITASYKNGM